MYQRINQCFVYSNNSQKQTILRNLIQMLIQRIIKIKSNLRQLYDFQTCIGDQYLPIDYALKQHKITPEEIKLELPRFFNIPQNFREQTSKMNQVFDGSPYDIVTVSHSLYNQQDPIQVTPQQAIANILKVERMRQNIIKGVQMRIQLDQVLKKHQLEQGQNMKINEAELISQNVIVVQKFLRGYLIRREHQSQINKEKIDMKIEYEETSSELNKDIEKLERIRKLELQIMQQEIEESFLDIKKRIYQNESLTIKENMIKQRREFIIKIFEESSGKQLPSKIQEIYQEQVPKVEAQKGKPDPKKKDPKKGKGVNEEQLITYDDTNEPITIQIHQMIEDYIEKWNSQINSDKNQINNQILVDQIFVDIQKEIQEHVDQLMQIELENLYFKFGIVKKKEPKAKKKANPKAPKIPGENLVQDLDVMKIAIELRDLGIL